MTVIAARKYPDRIEFASDSMLTVGDEKSAQDSFCFNKLYECNGLIVGSAGASYEGSLFRIYCSTHKPSGVGINSIVDFFFQFEQWIKTKSDGWRLENSYLICFEGHLFKVFSGLEIFEIKEFESIGVGYPIAKTALYLGKSPVEAVEIAIELSVDCGGKPILISVPLSDD